MPTPVPLIAMSATFRQEDQDKITKLMDLKDPVVYADFNGKDGAADERVIREVRDTGAVLWRSTETAMMVAADMGKDVGLSDDGGDGGGDDGIDAAM